MATHNGSEGLVHVGTDAVGELKSWQFTENATMIDTTVLSDSAQTFSAGTTNWSGSAECFLDETNTKKVTTRPIWGLLNKLPMFKDSQSGDLSNAKWLEQRVVNIPSSVRI